MTGKLLEIDRPLGRALWAEAALVGVTGAAVGVGLGLLLGTAAAELTGSRPTGVRVP